MYGVVNRAIEEMIILNHGAAKWREICAKAEVDVDVFVSNESYPDDVTYKLAIAATEALQIPIGDFLQAFGEHWVLKTGHDYYGSLLRSGGTNLKEFLINLPKFHTRVQLIYPQLRPPEFSCSDIGENSMRLHYFTHRPGLTHFVIGLVQGLGKLYGVTATATLIESKADGADHDIFDVSWPPSQET